MKDMLIECLIKGNNAVTEMELEAIGQGKEMHLADWYSIMADQCLQMA